MINFGPIGFLWFLYWIGIPLASLIILGYFVNSYRKVKTRQEKIYVIIGIIVLFAFIAGLYGYTLSIK